MLARLLLVCLVVGCAKVTSPEDSEIQKSAMAKAEVVQSALVKGDYGTVADYTHPKVVEQLGGREKMLDVMAAGLKAMKADGIEFTKVAVLDPSAPAKAGKDTYIFVPFDLVMKVPGKQLKTRGGLVGITGDGGKTWVFVDTAPGRDALKKVLPDLPDAIVIPAKEPPTVTDE